MRVLQLCKYQGNTVRVLEEYVIRGLEDYNE